MISRIMHNVVPLALAILHLQVSVIDAFVSCQTACQECVRAYESLDMLEVYCSMCRQCRDNRRKFSSIPVFSEKRMLVTKKIIVAPKKVARSQVQPRTMKKRKFGRQREEENDVLENWPEGCPTPPVCTSSEETTTSRPRRKTTRTRTPSTCPPVPTCKPKKLSTQMSTNMPTCMPCMPMCFMPCETSIGNRFMKMKHKIGSTKQTSNDFLEQETMTLPSVSTIPDLPSFNVPDVTLPDNPTGDGHTDLIVERFNPYNIDNLIRLPTEVMPQFDNRNPVFNMANMNSVNNVQNVNPPDYYYMYLGIPKNALNAATPNDMTF